MAAEDHDSKDASEGKSGRAVLWSVGLQAIGSCSTFAIAFVIAHTLGLAAQGSFGVLKSWLDVLVTALLFGLPQGLMHFSYQPGVGIAELRGLLQRYVALVVATAVLAGAIAMQQGFIAMGVVVLAVPGLVFHGLLRSLLLRAAGLISYALVTIAPAVSLFIGVVATVLLRSAHWEWAMLASSLASVAVVMAAASWHGLPPARGGGTPPPGIWSASLHNFVFNVCVAAQPALLLAMLVAWGADPSQVGALSLSFYFLQVFSVLAGFVAPVVFDRFAAGSSIAAVWAKDRELAWKVLLMIFVGLAALTLALPAIFRVAFQSSYAVAVDTCRLMTLAGGLVLLTRLIATLMLVAGRFVDMSRQAIARVVLSVAFAALIHRIFDVELSLAAAYGVLVSEVLVAVWGAVTISRLMNEARGHAQAHQQS